jgi:hypothetical protein
VPVGQNPLSCMRGLLDLRDTFKVPDTTCLALASSPCPVGNLGKWGRRDQGDQGQLEAAVVRYDITTHVFFHGTPNRYL